jgi:hypothetical protein
VLKICADIVLGGAALIRDEGPDVRASDVVGGEGDRRIVRLPTDLAPVKPRADVVLVGHARVPEGAANAARSEVRFAFGKNVAPSSRSMSGGASFDRRLRVFGDRVWRDIVGELLPGQPDPFKAIPLSWDRAFGGPGWDANPAGIGYSPPKTSPSRLPNLESPERPIVHPRDKVKATCFAPIPPWWVARSSLHGKSDDAYQHAPPEQRIDVVEGDEEFVLEGVHATLRRVEGSLPEERMRAFVVRAGGRFDELDLKLDAVTFDGDDLSIELVWRAVVETKAVDAPEIEAFFALTEPTFEDRQPIEACRRAYDAARA